MCVWLDHFLDSTVQPNPLRFQLHRFSVVVLTLSVTPGPKVASGSRMALLAQLFLICAF